MQKLTAKQLNDIGEQLVLVGRSGMRNNTWIVIEMANHPKKGKAPRGWGYGVQNYVKQDLSGAWVKDKYIMSRVVATVKKYDGDTVVEYV